MKKILFILFLLISFFVNGQNGSIIINDNCNIIMNGNANVIINQPNILGIQKTGNLLGGIICDNEQSRIIWQISTNTGNYIIPFKILNTLIPFSINISSGGVGVGKVLISTYHTTTNNTIYPNGNSYFSSVTNMNLNGIDNSANAVDRFWIINYDGYTTIPTSQFTMTYDAANDLNGIIEADLQSQYWNGTQWILPSTGIAIPASDNVNSIPNITSNAPWVLVNKLNPLPITLTFFSAFCEDNIRKIIWETAQEINVDRYEIYRSFDAIDYELLTKENTAGSTTMPEAYIIYDNELVIGDVYYKLKEIDYDGYEKTFDAIAINCDITNINLYPNPSTTGQYITISGDVYSIKIYDILGREVNAQIINNQIFGINSGVYIVYLNGRLQVKIIIL